MRCVSFSRFPPVAHLNSDLSLWVRGKSLSRLKRWAPVNATAVGTRFVGDTVISAANHKRIGGQAGVATWTVPKAAVTGAALVATVWSGALGSKMAENDFASRRPCRVLTVDPRRLRLQKWMPSSRAMSPPSSPARLAGPSPRSGSGGGGDDDEVYCWRVESQADSGDTCVVS